MQIGDALARRFAGIDDDAVAALGNADLIGDLGGGKQQVAEDGFVGLGSIVERFQIITARN